MLDVKARVEEANAETVKRMIAGDQVLVDVVPAREAIPRSRARESYCSTPTHR